MEKTQKKSHKNMWITIALISAFLLLLLICINLDCKFPCVLEKNRSNITTVLAQIQIAIFALTVTVISICISLLKDDVYGVCIKDIFKLRKGITFNLLSTMIVLFMITILMLVSMILELLICNMFLIVSTIIVAIWSSCQDLPICLKNDNAIINLLKKNVQTKQDGINDLETQNKLLKGLLYSKKLDKVYDLLKTKDQAKNKELVDRLMNIMINDLTSLQYYTDVPNLKIKANDTMIYILENIETLLQKENNIFNDYENNENLSLHLTRLIFYIHEHECQMDTQTSKRFENYINSLFFKLYILNDGENSFEFKTLHHLLRWTLKECDLWVATLLQKEYSRWHYSFGEHKTASILFSEISFIMFVYYNYENLLSKEKKDLIKKQIEEPITISTTERILPWNIIFNEYLDKFDLRFDDLTKNIDPGAWEFMLMNECKSCILTDISLASWWFMCLISSDNLYRFNSEELNGLDDRSKQILVNYLDILFEGNTKVIKIQSQFGDFKNTFAIRDDKLQNINQFTRIIDELFEFKNKYKKDKELFEAIAHDINSDNRLMDLTTYLKESFVAELNKSPFLDNSINLDSVEAKGFFNIEEIFDMDNSKSLYNDMIHRCYQHDFINYFDNYFKTKYISFTDKITNKKLEKILQLKPTYTASKELYAINRLTHLESNFIKDIIELDDKISVINDITLPNGYYTNKKGIRFNYEIFVFELKELTDVELQKCVDNQKSDDGTYFYNGIQYEFNELFELFKRKYFTMKLYVKYKFIFDDKNIVRIDPWGFMERRKRTE